MNQHRSISFEIWSTWIRQGLHPGGNEELEPHTMQEVREILAIVPNNGFVQMAEVLAEQAVPSNGNLRQVLEPQNGNGNGNRASETSSIADQRYEVDIFSEEVIYQELTRLFKDFRNLMDGLLAFCKNARTQAIENNVSLMKANCLFPPQLSSFPDGVESVDAIIAIDSMLDGVERIIAGGGDLTAMQVKIDQADSWFSSLIEDEVRAKVVDGPRLHNYRFPSLYDNQHGMPGNLREQSDLLISALSAWQKLKFYLRQVRIKKAELQLYRE